MADVGRGGSDQWPKWQTALLVGTPVALGLAGLWYYTRRKPGDEKSKRDKPEKGEDSTTTEGTTSKVQSPSDNVKAQQKSTSRPDVDLNPLEKAQAAKNKGNKYFKAAKYDQAIKCYTEAIRICPPENKQEIATFYQNRAAAYEQLKNYDQVIADCTEALKYNNKYVKALFRRAKACEITGRLMQCLEDVTAVCILESFQNHQSLYMADRVLKDIGKAKAKEALMNRQPVKPSPQFIRTYYSSFMHDPLNQYLNLTSQASEMEGGIEHSKTELTKASEKNQDEISEKEQDESMEKSMKGEEVKLSPYRQAVDCFENHDYDDIVQLCSMEINLSNSSYLPEALLLRATFYLLRGEGNKAMEDFDRLLELNDVDKRIKSNALIKRGSLQMQNGQTDAALADFQQAIDIDPENSDIYHHRGQLYLLTERIEDAVTDFEKSLELSPHFAVAQVQKCYTDYRLAFHRHSPLQLQNAISAFQKTIEKFPDCAEGYALYGQALCDQQMFDKAENNFMKSIELEPDNGNTYVHRGLLRLQWKQDIDEATKLINKAIEVDDKCEFAYETLATIEIQRGNLDKAIELFNKAISLAKTEVEMAHLYSLRDAAITQSNVAKTLDITIPNMAASFME
ncbi:hypothetical protein LSH36_170g04057 [Paralvinella palmiformis]|uniref:Mitochondrial import receptor subunit TOM70 n=1 Tax=Paralvinella palmiformis TaxID=53620 RepID=A0AAD9N815_9ANNE|nr:hypothetical protein LSH36_170g04057 [Paralvinella palmiformis]